LHAIQQSQGFNFEHEQTYLTADREQAEEYARQSPQGSEFLTAFSAFIKLIEGKDLKGWEELIPDELLVSLQILTTPYLATVKYVKLDEVAPEHEQHYPSLEEQIDDMDLNLKHGIPNRQGFRLLSGIHMDRLKIERL
jgi:hypothetical protein